MRIVFVRHGERVDKTDSSPITEWGWTAARRTGRWLANQGLEPALLVHTRKLRTKETAVAVLESVGIATVQRGRPGLPINTDGWRALETQLAKWAPDGGDVILVGHGKTQMFLEKEFGGSAFGVPRKNKAAAFLLEHSDLEGWRCVSVWPGAPAESGTHTGGG